MGYRSNSFGCPHYPGDEEAYRNAIAADFRLPCGQQNCWLELEREQKEAKIVKRRKRGGKS